MDLAEKILNRFKISKPQRKFLITLFSAILTAHGKINFRNLSRYSDVSEKTYSRQFAQPFAFVAFNREVTEEGLGSESERIVGLGCLLLCPSQAKKTYGLDYFWNGCHRRSEKGLEVSSVAIVDVLKHTGFTLSVRQTESADEHQVSELKPKEEVTQTDKKTKTKQKKRTKKKGKSQIEKAEHQTGRR